MNRMMFLMALLLAAMALAGETEREEDAYSVVSGDYAASHILVQYKRSEKAPEGMTRTKKEAEEKAEMLLAKVKANPGTFEALARAESDGPSAVKGGYLGGFNRGDMASKFEAMVKKLKDGEIAPSVVKTGFGYHIIRREPMRVHNYSVAAILVAFEGAERLRSLADRPEVYERSKADAKARIAQAKAALAGESFAAVASRMGDLPNEGGFFGVFRKGDGPLSDQLVELIAPLTLGASSDVVELPIGMAILLRRPVVRYRAKRIWIGHSESENLRKPPKRSKEEARTLAKDIMAEVRQDPDAFADAAKKYSAGPFARTGGLMASWYQGLQTPSFEAIVASLEIDAMTPEPVETEEGFFIVTRLH